MACRSNRLPMDGPEHGIQSFRQVDTPAEFIYDVNRR
jgi:hypothetical protein